MPMHDWTRVDDGIYHDFHAAWIGELLDVLDAADVRVYVDLDGGWGEDILEAHLDYFKNPEPERFRVFGGVDWAKWPEHGDQFGEWAAKRLRAQAAHGADGLKIWKPLGLEVRRLDAPWPTTSSAPLMTVDLGGPATPEALRTLPYAR